MVRYSKSVISVFIEQTFLFVEDFIKFRSLRLQLEAPLFWVNWRPPHDQRHIDR